MKNILVTGANGFVGTALCRRLRKEGFEVVAAIRRADTPFVVSGTRSVSVGQIDAQTDWTKAVRKIDTVVHLAARVHKIGDDQAKQIEVYRQVNVDGTRKLAESAACAGVKRFVFLSSVKVNGEENDTAYTEQDSPSPEDAYGISKMEAEQALHEVSENSEMGVVIIRPPMVYGPGVKANFLSLMRLVSQKIPLPLNSVRNQRSFIYLENLVDCIHHCMTHSVALGRTYLVSDDRDLSTPELIRSLAFAMDTRVVMFPCYPALLRIMADLIGRKSAAKRLLGSLTVDISKIKMELGWAPPVSVQSGLLATANWFRNEQER